jgi:hypothetical protein
MNKVFEEILAKYTSGEVNAEETNKALKEAGANFSVDPAKATEGWTEAEMKEGFRDPDPNAPKLPMGPDMSRRKDLAGQTIIQYTKKGRYEVSYDELGYAWREVPVRD